MTAQKSSGNLFARPFSYCGRGSGAPGVLSHTWYTLHTLATFNILNDSTYCTLYILNRPGFRHRSHNVAFRQLDGNFEVTGSVVGFYSGKWQLPMPRNYRDVEQLSQFPNANSWRQFNASFNRLSPKTTIPGLLRIVWL